MCANDRAGISLIRSAMRGARPPYSGLPSPIAREAGGGIVFISVLPLAFL